MVTGRATGRDSDAVCGLQYPRFMLLGKMAAAERRSAPGRRCLIGFALVPILALHAGCRPDTAATASSGGSSALGAGGASAEAGVAGQRVTQSSGGVASGGAAGNSSTERGGDAGDGGVGAEIEAGGSSGGASCTLEPVWSAMNSSGIEWVPNGQAAPAFKHGYARGKVYVLFPLIDPATLTLLAFDVCKNSWSKVALDFTTKDVFDIGGRYCATSWRDDHFVCYMPSDPEGNVPANAAEIFPEQARLASVPASAVIAKDPVWELPKPATYRRPVRADAKGYVLMWGGDYENSMATGTEAVYWPSNDGQVYSYAARTWKSLTMNGAPSARYLPKIIALGDRFWIWGGFGASQQDGSVDPRSALSDGAIYDPAADRFTAISSLGAPAQPRADHVTGPSSLVALTNGSDVFVVDSMNGAGGVYSSALDRWYAIGATTRPTEPLEPGLSSFQVLDGGDLIWIGSEEVRIASRTGGEWRSLRQGPYQDSLSVAPAITASPLPAFNINVWTGSALVRWGASRGTAHGCEQPPPPGFGCDPLYIYENYAFGVILSTRALMN